MRARAVGLALVLAGAALPGCAQLDSAQAPSRIDEQATSRPSTPGPGGAHTGSDSQVRRVSVPDLPEPLSAGSCRMYPPTVEARGFTVFLDAGHGGYDPGALGATSTGKTIDEATLTLAVARRATNRLQGEGYAVVLSRSTDDNVLSFGPSAVNGGALTAEAVRADVLARAACANSVDADVLLSLHFNSFGDPAVGGTQTLYAPNRPFGARSARLAEVIQANAVDGFQAAGWEGRDRGVSRDIDVDGEALTLTGEAYGNLLILGPRKVGHNETPSEMPGAVIELLFLTHPAEADIASSPRGQQVMSAAIVRGVEEFLSEP